MTLKRAPTNTSHLKIMEILADQRVHFMPSRRSFVPKHVKLETLNLLEMLAPADERVKWRERFGPGDVKAFTPELAQKLKGVLPMNIEKKEHQQICLSTKKIRDMLADHRVHLMPSRRSFVLRYMKFETLNLLEMLAPAE